MVNEAITKINNTVLSRAMTNECHHFYERLKEKLLALPQKAWKAS